MKILKWTLIISGLILSVIIISGVVFKLVLSQGVLTGYEVNRPDADRKFLIASQKSGFKSSLVTDIIDELKGWNAFIKVIDVTRLPSINAADWDAVVLINAYEAGRMQKDADEYLKTAENKGSTILVTTSGSGIWKPENFPYDTFSTASTKEDVVRTKEHIIERLRAIP